MFTFLRSLHIAFQNGCTTLHSHQQCMMVPFFPHAHQHLLLVLFLVIAILTGLRWNLSVVLICISFMARDGEHFFMCFLAIWISSLKKFCLVQLSISWLVHWFWGFFELPVYSGYQFFVWYIASKYFLPPCGCSLQFRDNFFCFEKVLTLCSPICPSFLLVAGLLGFYWGSPLLYLLLTEYSMLFSVVASEFQVWYSGPWPIFSWY
jgi:hypothetical protein